MAKIVPNRAELGSEMKLLFCSIEQKTKHAHLFAVHPDSRLGGMLRLRRNNDKPRSGGAWTVWS
jgi:hypothetical protein